MTFQLLIPMSESRHRTLGEEPEAVLGHRPFQRWLPIPKVGQEI